MINQNFVILGVALNVIGGLSYLINTLKGKVKPNKVTWFLWTLAPLIAFFAEIKQGVGIQSMMTFIVGFNPLLIFLASFVNKKSQWNITKLDVICGILSIAGLILWQITKIGNIAIIFSIGADFLAAIPTVIKSYVAPDTEDFKVFLLSFISAGITILTIKVWNLANYGFPVYILLMNSLLFILIKFKVGKITST